MGSSIVACVLLVLVALSGVRIAPDGARLVVVRLGQPLRIDGPGIRFILPFLDRIHRVDLDSTLPEWRSLAEAEIEQRLLHLARSGVLDANAS